MPDFTEDFQSLMRRVQEGSEEAAWELVEGYGEAVRRAVRRALNVRLRSKFDSLDFVQLVWCSFFRRTERAVRFTRPDELVAFLVKMATNKVRLEIRRRLLTQQYNVNRESRLDDLPEDQKSLADRRASAVELAIARERWERIIAGQPPRYRQIIQLRLQGLSNVEIAHRLHIAHTTVYRFLERLLHEKLE